MMEERGFGEYKFIAKLNRLWDEGFMLKLKFMGTVMGGGFNLAVTRLTRRAMKRFSRLRISRWRRRRARR